MLPVYLICLPHMYIVTLHLPSSTWFRLHFLSPLWSKEPQALSAFKSFYNFIYHPHVPPSLFFPSLPIPSHPPLSPLSIKVELYRCQQCKRRWEWALKTVSLCLGFIVPLEGCRVTTCHQHIGRPIHFTQGYISQGYSVTALYVCVSVWGLLANTP